VQPYETQLALATALAVGLLIGLEREQTKAERPAGQLGGVRTYPIVALIGALATLLAPASAWIPLIALLGVFALVAIAYAAEVKREPDPGMTTEVSVIGTYLLGALAASRVIEPMAERLLLVAASGVAITFLLSSKQWFHAIAAKVSHADFYATVKFLIVAVIVLPLLPNRALGPLDAINPRTLGLLVVTISGLSFIGYVAMRLFGAKRGLLLGAALGGLVSSTAVTLSFSRRAKEAPSLAPVAAGAIAVAWTIMVVRVAVLVAVVAPQLLRPLAAPLGVVIAATLIGLLVVFRRDGGDAGPQALELKNPFDLGSAIKVTAVFGLVLLASRAAVEYIGDRGLYLASALGGTTDVDAVTVSAAKATAAVGPGVAITAILIGIAVNTIVKTGLAIGVGGGKLGRRVAIVGAIVVAASAAGFAITALAF
jgi:uncharacterized membrane protein (DUF4010 family)